MKPTTIELTGKPIKLGFIISYIVFWGSLIALFKTGSDIAGFGIFAGALLWIFMKGVRWWEHG